MILRFLPNFYFTHYIFTYIREDIYTHTHTQKSYYIYITFLNIHTLYYVNTLLQNQNQNVSLTKNTSGLIR